MGDKAHAEIVTKLRRERDEARAEVERLRADHKYACDVADNLRAEIKTLRNQAVLNLEDSERYRWLRNKVSTEDLFGIEFWLCDTDEEIDAAIDAAMRGGK